MKSDTAALFNTSVRARSKQRHFDYKSKTKVEIYTSVVGKLSCNAIVQFRVVLCDYQKSEAERKCGRSA